MKFTLCLVVIVFVLLGSAHPQQSANKPRIISGTVVEGKNASWHVAIMHNQRLICSGSLLKRNVVLTAAECIKDLEPADITVRGGSKNFKSGGQLRNVRETIHHPKYDEISRINNVALIHLMSPFNPKANNIRHVRLPDANETLPTSVLVYGWGVTNTRGNKLLTKNLRMSKERIYSTKKCARYLPDQMLSEFIFCTGDRVKRADICNDDLGSPAIYNGTQFGVVMESNACSKNAHTTLYSNIIATRTWIEATLREIKASKPVAIQTTPNPSEGSTKT